jgi:predicted NBD/HSP70 family sugar kinase
MTTILVVDIGGTTVKFGFTVAEEPQTYVRLFSSDELRIQDPIANLAKMIRVVIDEAQIKPDIIVSTVPGFLDTDEDRVLFAANIPELNDRRLASELATQIGVPVLLERDSVLTLIGENLAGAARGAGTVLGLFFGTGVGAACLHDGHPFRGAAWALEIGHMPFKGEGRRFEDTRPDCLESYVSGRVLQMIADCHAASIENIFILAARNNDLAAILKSLCAIRP